MPPVLGPVSPVPAALEVGARWQGHGAGAVEQQEQRQLVAAQILFRQHRAAGQGGASETQQGVAVIGDQHALALCQSIHLEHRRTAAGAQVESQLRLVVQFRRLGRRDVVAEQERLAERLAALQTRLGGGRPHYRQTGRAQAVGDAGRQRVVGADHRQIDGIAPRRHAERGAVVSRHLRQVAAHLGGAGVPGRGPHRLHASSRRELPRQRVFAATAANYQDAHGGDAQAPSRAKNVRLFWVQHLGQLLHVHAALLRYEVRGVGDVGWPVALAAMCGRDHERRFRLDQHALDRNLLQGVVQVARVAVGDIAGERDEQVEFQSLARIVAVLGVAVQHAAARRQLVAQDLQGIAARIAVVDDHGEMQPFRHCQLPHEQLHLGVAISVLAEVVEPDLADGHHPLALGVFFHRPFPVSVEGTHLGGGDADAVVDVRETSQVVMKDREIA